MQPRRSAAEHPAAGLQVPTSRRSLGRLSGATSVSEFAGAVRAALAASGLTLREIEVALSRYGSGLQSSIAVLSRWQNGVNAPACTTRSVQRVLALERCLGLPAGDLALLIPDIQLPAPAGGRPRRAISWKDRRRLDDAAHRLGRAQPVIPVAARHHHHLGRDAEPARTVISATVRAMRDGADRHWLLLGPGTSSRPTVRAITQCSIGEVVSERPAPAEPEGRGRLAVEVIWDRVLRRGEKHHVALSVASAAPTSTLDGEPVEWSHLLAHPCERLELAITFHGRTPKRVARCVWDGRRQGTGRTELPVTSASTHRVLLADPVPAGYGWAWSF